MSIGNKSSLGGNAFGLDFKEAEERTVLFLCEFSCARFGTVCVVGEKYDFFSDGQAARRSEPSVVFNNVDFDTTAGIDFDNDSERLLFAR